jgi:hypothetical protein
VADTLLFPSHAEMNLNRAAGNRENRRALGPNGARKCSTAPGMQESTANRFFRRLLDDVVFGAVRRLNVFREVFGSTFFLLIIVRRGVPSRTHFWDLFGGGM